MCLTGLSGIGAGWCLNGKKQRTFAYSACFNHTIQGCTIIVYGGFFHSSQSIYVKDWNVCYNQEWKCSHNCVALVNYHYMINLRSWLLLFSEISHCMPVLSAFIIPEILQNTTLALSFFDAWIVVKTFGNKTTEAE